MEIAIDTSVVVGILTQRDTWHQQATALWQAIKKQGHTPIYFDCVIAEAASVSVRRLSEQRQAQQIDALLQRLQMEFTSNELTWILPDVPRLYPDIIDLMRHSGGELNFHDALIALACRERNIPVIASFDSDFDRLPWLRRFAQPSDVQRS